MSAGRFRSMAAGLMLSALLASPLAAKVPPIVPTKPIEQKNLASGNATIDPTKGYIFVRAKVRSAMTFFRVPDQQDRADYDFLFEETFAKQKASYPRKLERWKSNVAVAKQIRKDPPPKPEEPFRETFSIGGIEKRTAITVGPGYVFAKSDDSSFSYLQEVKPGTYIYYGPVATMENGTAFGTCYCMGSVRFDVKAGAITDLGDFLNVAPDFASQRTADLPAKLELPAAGNASYGLPATLASYPSSPAQFHASGKLNNFYGVILSRMPPVPGVLAYQRDTVIDVGTGAPVPPGLGGFTPAPAAVGQ